MFNIVNTYFRIYNQWPPGDIADADEGVYDMSTEVYRNIFNFVTAYSGTINGPIAEVADNSGWLVT